MEGEGRSTAIVTSALDPEAHADAAPATGRLLHGLGVNGTQRVGIVARMPAPPTEPAPSPRLVTVQERTHAKERFAEARQAVRGELRERASRADETSRAVLEATALMVNDPMLARLVVDLIEREGETPARAVWAASGQVAAVLSAHGGLMAQRVQDVHDVRNRLVCALLGRSAPGVPLRDEPFVLVADDLAPADTATLDPSMVLAIVTAGGGPTSHTTILARSLGITAVVAVKGADGLPDGATVLVDGESGNVLVDPSASERRRIEQGSVPMSTTFSGPGRTRDGHQVPLLANLSDPTALGAVQDAGAEGIGLFRTEFCFLDRATEPRVAEQVAIYRRVFEAHEGRRVVIRTLDAGADKPLPFLAGDPEPNPALGVRGYRTARRSPELLRGQLEAIALAGAGSGADVSVMAPMISTAAEAGEFVAAARRQGLRTVGVMVEVPAAAICADAILAECDFVSIGTNDLAQYTFAADRELPDVAELNDPWQPAVLRLVAMTCESAARQGKPVSVCGEAAADPVLACVLVGLGVTSLSMSPGAIPAVGARLAQTELETCRTAAEAAMAEASAHSARTAARQVVGS